MPLEAKKLQLFSVLIDACSSNYDGKENRRLVRRLMTAGFKENN